MSSYVGSAFDIREDFAGPGGWSQALRSLGHGERARGFELDGPACNTARMAGHKRTQVDVRELRDDEYPLTGYIASPPCQTFSRAGKGEGRAAIDDLRFAAKMVANGALPERAVAALGATELNENSLLVLEPLLVVATHFPQWVAFEQVPAVLPVWEAIAEQLDGLGYYTATGYVYSEQHGVPQTRKRAVLLAHQDRPVALPVPTHSKYHTHDGSILDSGVQSWVSMAAGLGWPPDRDELIQIVEPRMNNQSGSEFDLAWPSYRPAPVIAGRELVTMPGANANRFNGSTKSRNDGIRVTVAEAGVLQSFPADYPWQGTKSKQLEQVGNCVPPLMGAAILSALGCVA